MEYFSQNGMEYTLRTFIRYLNEKMPNFSGVLKPALYRCNFEESTLVCEYIPQPWMVNASGTVHGGIIASMFDVTMGSLIYYMSGEKMPPTITLKIDYVTPGRVDHPIYVGVKCTRCGKTMGYVTGKAWQKDENKPFSTADSVFYADGEVKTCQQLLDELDEQS